MSFYPPILAYHHCAPYLLMLDCVVFIIDTTQELSVYIRAVNIERDGEQYGTYYQAVRSYREQGKVKQEVVHLGQHSTPDKALRAWAREIEELARTRPKQARKLQAKWERLRELSGVQQG
jgi:hypothetical protein